MPGAVENCAHGTGGGICGGYAALHGPCAARAASCKRGDAVPTASSRRMQGAVGKASCLCRAHRGAAGAIWAWEGTRRAWEGWQAARRDSFPPAPLPWDGLLRGQPCWRFQHMPGVGGGRCTGNPWRMPRATCGENGYLRVNGTKVGSCACRAFAQENGQCAARWCHPCRAVTCLALTRENGQCAAR